MVTPSAISIPYCISILVVAHAHNKPFDVQSSSVASTLGARAYGSMLSQSKQGTKKESTRLPLVYQVPGEDFLLSPLSSRNAYWIVLPSRTHEFCASAHITPATVPNTSFVSIVPYETRLTFDFLILGQRRKQKTGRQSFRRITKGGARAQQRRYG